jgi:hypothetical protein
MRILIAIALLAVCASAQEVNPVWKKGLTPDAGVRKVFSDPVGAACAAADPLFDYQGTVYSCQGGVRAVLAGTPGPAMDINALVEQASPVLADDFVATHDVIAAALRKVKLVNLPFERVLTVAAPITRAANEIGCAVASGSLAGCLSAANWTTFNDKVDGPASSTSDTLAIYAGSSGKVLTTTNILYNTGYLEFGNATEGGISSAGTGRSMAMYGGQSASNGAVVRTYGRDYVSLGGTVDVDLFCHAANNATLRVRKTVNGPAYTNQFTVACNDGAWTAKAGTITSLAITGLSGGVLALDSGTKAVGNVTGNSTDLVQVDGTSRAIVEVTDGDKGDITISDSGDTQTIDAGAVTMAKIAADIDFSSKTTTKPHKTGTSAPASCVVGETFFDTDATAGQNIYVCTATNTWTLQGDGGGGIGSAPYNLVKSLDAGAHTTVTCADGVDAITGECEVAVDTTDLATKSGDNALSGITSYPATASQTVTASSTVQCNATRIKLGSASAVTITTQPTIVDSVKDGQECILTNGNAADAITLTSGTAENLKLSASTVAIPAGQHLRLIWDTTLGLWAQAVGAAASADPNMVTAAGTLTSNAPVIGAGSKAVSVGSTAGNTTVFNTQSGAATSGAIPKYDANGNLTVATVGTDYLTAEAGPQWFLASFGAGTSVVVAGGSDNATNNLINVAATKAAAGVTVGSGVMTIAHALIDAGDKMDCEFLVERQTASTSDGDTKFVLRLGGTSIGTSWTNTSASDGNHFRIFSHTYFIATAAQDHVSQGQLVTGATMTVGSTTQANYKTAVNISTTDYTVELRGWIGTATQVDDGMAMKAGFCRLWKGNY